MCGTDETHLVSSSALFCGAEILQGLTMVDTTNVVIRTEKEPFLLIASLGYNESEDVSPTAIPLRRVYRNDKHFSLPKSRRKDDITDTAWLPPYRPLKAVPFRDVWLISKKELRRL